MRSHRLKLRVAGQEENLQPVVQTLVDAHNVVQDEVVDNIPAEVKIEEPPQITAEAVETKQIALKKPPFKKK